MKQALLVIDVQRELFNGERRPFEADAVIERINGLTARARQANVPVVFIQHEHPGSPLEFGNENWQLALHLKSIDTDTFLRKTTPDSFLRTNLNALLTQWGTEQVVVCGYASEFCVDTTTRSAAAHGYPVIIAADAHTTHDKSHATGETIRAHHNATLSAMRGFGPVIEAVPVAELIFA